LSPPLTVIPAQAGIYLQMLLQFANFTCKKHPAQATALNIKSSKI
jgi:hypothetical protein